MSDLFTLLSKMMTQQPTPGNSVTITPDDIGGIIRIGEELYYVDVIRYPGQRPYAIVLVNEKGEIQLIISEGQRIEDTYIYTRFSNMQLHARTISLEDIRDKEESNIRDTYRELIERLHDVVFFENEQYYKLLGTWIMYSWLHTLYSKKSFLFVTGFYSTGKSVVAGVVKRIARNPVEADPSNKNSVVWALGFSRGIFVLDETDVLPKQYLMKLRRMHDEGWSEVKMMADFYGWIQFTLNLSSPVLIAGTHLPQDPALLSRGFIIRMHYGKPRITNLNQVDWSDLKGKIFISVIKEWKRYIRELDLASKRVEDKAIHERLKDVITPLYAVARLVGENPSFLYRLGRLSYTEALTITRTNRAIFYVLSEMLRKGYKRRNRLYLLETDLVELLYNARKLYGLSQGEVKYIESYFISASHPVKINGIPGLEFRIEDILAQLRGLEQLREVKIKELEEKLNEEKNNSS